MTAIANLPDLRPSLLLDFANSGRVDPRIQCTRSSSATCYGPDGKLRTVAANVPRIDYDPATGKCLGLLVEEARTNLLPYSEQLENVAWTKSGVSITANSEVAPNGTTTADKIVENTEGGVSHDIRGSISSSSGTYTFSAYLKAAGRNFCELFMSDGATGQVTIRVDLTLGTSLSASSGSWTGMTTTVTPAGSGWYRVAITATQGAGTALLCRIRLSASLLASGTVYTGDGTSGVFAWGVQLEAGASPTSYIQTEASAVTRAGDAISMEMPTYNDISICTDFMHGGKLANTRALGLYAVNAISSFVQVIGSNSTGTASAGVFAGPAGPNTTIGAFPATSGRADRVAFSRAGSNGAMLTASRGGALTSGAHSGTTAAMQTLAFGNSTTAGLTALNGWVRRVSIWLVTLSQSQLNKITEV